MNGAEIAAVLALPLPVRHAISQRCMERDAPCYSGWYGCTSMDSKIEQWVYDGASSSPLSTVAGSMLRVLSQLQAQAQTVEKKDIKVTRAKVKKLKGVPLDARFYIVPVDTSVLLELVGDKFRATECLWPSASLEEGESPLTADRWSAAVWWSQPRRVTDKRGDPPEKCDIEVTGGSPLLAVLGLLVKAHEWVAEFEGGVR